MPQGALKSGGGGGSGRKNPTATHSASQRAHATKMHRTVPSKKAKTARIQKQVRKNSAGLTGNLEQKLAERAGYTEMVGAASKKGKEKAGSGKGKGGLSKGSGKK